MIPVPEFWRFEATIVAGSFIASTVAAYFIYWLGVRRDRNNRQLQEQREQERQRTELTSDQWYQLADVNRRLTNSLFADGRITEYEVPNKEIRLAVADAMFEIWHLEPRVVNDDLLSLTRALETLLVHFSFKASSTSHSSGVYLEKSGLPALADKIRKNESDIRDGFRKWMGKDPLRYVTNLSDDTV